MEICNERTEIKLNNYSRRPEGSAFSNDSIFQNEISLDNDTVICAEGAIFLDIDAAANHILRLTGNQNNKDIIIKKINKAIVNHKKCYGFKWKIKKIKKGEI